MRIEDWNRWYWKHFEVIREADSSLNIPGSLNPGISVCRWKVTRIPRVARRLRDEDDDVEPGVCDVEIEDKITDTTVEDILNGR